MIGKKYVCGFMFNDSYEHVLLIEKKKPDWQKGKLNGIGGKIEPDEAPYVAMVREFHEETGIFHTDWNNLCELSGDDWTVIFYWAVGDISKAKRTTEEIPMVISIKYLPRNIIPNLSWLIPLAMDRTTDNDGIKRIKKE